MTSQHLAAQQGVVPGRTTVPNGLCREAIMLVARLTCENLAELPGYLGLDGGAGRQGPFAPDQMLLPAQRALGIVDGLDEHLLLPQLDEADLPGGEKGNATQVTLTHTHQDPNSPRAARPPGFSLVPTSGLFLCRVPRFT